jgi:HD superfamily phosphohydrolase
MANQHDHNDRNGPSGEQLQLRYGDWLVDRTLGEGFFGRVYLAHRGDEQAAVKIATGGNETGRVRLRVEQESLKVFDHPGIPRLLDSGEEDGAPYFVMTLAPGVTLKDEVEDWQRVGRVHGARETIDILRGFLDILRHIHDCDRVHRDVKDANVLVDGATVSLIDFGFCKQIGVPEMRDQDSFWRAGAARFSPLTKLNNPSLAAPNHDVYAAGVLGYRLLTGNFPWSVSAAEDLGALKRLIREGSLVFPHEINSLVPIPLSRFVATLLSKHDLNRPTASDALQQLEELAESLDTEAYISPWRGALTSRPHVVRDQVHGDIRLTDYEYRVLNTAEMQRLRWIKQLGLTNLVYPGAEHSRLAHSLGTLECVERILTAIEQESGTRIDSETRHVARLYGLTHDISHIASGHTIEDELGFFHRHDENQGRFDRLLSSKDSELGQVLAQSEWGREVFRLLNPATNDDDRGVVGDMVSGVLGADVLDYIDRDSANCGLDHRVDSAIYRQIRLHSRESPNSVLYSHEGGKYGVRADRHYAVENLLAERYALFLKVYTHSAKIAADAVLSKALTIRKNSIKEQDFEWFGDDSLLHWLEAYNRNPIVPSLAKRLRGRNLPVGVYRARVLEPDVHDQNNHNMYRDMQARLLDAGWLTPAGRARFEAEVSKKSGVSADRLFFYLPSHAPGYKRTELWATESATANPLKSESSESGALARRHLSLWQAWLFVSDATATERLKVAEVAESVFNRSNMIDRYRQSLFSDG